MKAKIHSCRNIAAHLLRVGILLMALVWVGCTGGSSPTWAPVPASPAEPQEASGSPSGAATSPPVTSGSAPATPTGVPADKPAPAPGLPSDLLEGQDHSEGPSSPFTPDNPFPSAPDRNPYRLAAQLSPNASPGRIPRVVNPSPVSYSQGREDTFWLVDFRDMKVYQSDFELKLVSPSAYWYMEKGLRTGKDEPELLEDLEQSVREFEDRISPRVTAAFGEEWSPGVDNDPHLNIIHAELQGVAGYYSSSDEYPQSVYPYSNQRETIYINARSLSVGGQSYLEVLAHELQHAIHWNNDPSEDTWVNEGLSELAVSVAGYPSSSIKRFSRTPTVPLIHWPLDNANISAHYGGASLFMHYLWEHYRRGSDLRQLVREPADGIAGINAYLDQEGYDATFREVFRDWVAANLLDEDQGRYGYRELDVKATIGESVGHFSEFQSRIPQYSAEYIKVSSLAGPVRLRFEGHAHNQLLPVEVDGRGCWWSNSGDSISSTLTRTVDLRGQGAATLSYQVWYSLEKGWDYAYVQVSVDGGKTWQILETPHTTPENPIGNSFGPGYTGDSHDWITEHIDLSPYAGREVMLRFHYITDDAVNGAGLCVRGITVPEAGLLENDPDWQADGFVHTDNQVQQDYIVQVIQMGDENQVSLLSLDANNSGELVIPEPHNLDQLVVAVAALAPKTLEKAAYTLTVEPAD